MRKIAIYGKGGIGKSTTVSNLSVAFRKLGYKVMQIGCDPKADSTRNLTQGKSITTVLQVLKEFDDASLEQLVHEGDSGVLCVEAGGPLPGIGCAGRGIITAFEKLDELDAYDEFEPDIILYDVLGDVVCGGFSMPLRNGYADYVYIVTSGEMMSLYAATNISYAINNLSKNKSAKLMGLIINSKNIENEKELVDKVAIEIDTSITHQIPRDAITQKAEDVSKTVMELYEDSDLAKEYLLLANQILEDCADV